MSPEQIRGEALDARSDTFSFGSVLYEMLSGRTPFSAVTAAETISSILTREPTPLVRYAPGLPEELQRIVRKCLAKDTRRRYQAIEKDSNFALAHAGVAESYNALGGFNVLRPKDVYPKARSAAMTALKPLTFS